MDWGNVGCEGDPKLERVLPKKKIERFFCDKNFWLFFCFF